MKVVLWALVISHLQLHFSSALNAPVFNSRVVNVNELRSQSFLLESSAKNIDVESVSASSGVAPAWWADGLSFKCTGCGKCCQNEGEVWLDIDEAIDISQTLQIPTSQFLDQYVDTVRADWVKLKNSENKEMGIEKCVFLGADNKMCTIYESRPIQCRTYPYWPRLLMSESNWSAEAVLPDHIPITDPITITDPAIASADSVQSTLASANPNLNTDSKPIPSRHWSHEWGGCEGVNHADAEKVTSDTIHRNSEKYQMYLDKYPFMGTDDKARFLSKASVIESVNKASRAWVKDFVVKYALCPFAESVFTSSKIRYRVCTSSNTEEIYEKIKFEMLHLMTTPADQLATTLIMLPFAFPDFQDFYDFSLALEDEWLPIIEKGSKGPTSSSNLASDLLTRSESADEVKPEKSMNKLKTLIKKKQKEMRETAEFQDSREIQLATFHPAFQWADTEINAPINFEKRAPFATVNLLRADVIREYASQKKTLTKTISEANVISLEAAGSETLSREFEMIIQLALDQ